MGYGEEMKIKLEVEIGTEGHNCWGCRFGPVGEGARCILFNSIRLRDGMVYKRLDACMDAENKELTRSGS